MIIRPIFTHHTRIYWEDTDGGRLVYHANYLKFAERARSEWLRALGFNQSDLAGGFDPPDLAALGHPGGQAAGATPPADTAVAAAPAAQGDPTPTMVGKGGSVAGAGLRTTITATIISSARTGRAIHRAAL